MSRHAVSIFTALSLLSPPVAWAQGQDEVVVSVPRLGVALRVTCTGESEVCKQLKRHEAALRARAQWLKRAIGSAIIKAIATPAAQQDSPAPQVELESPTPAPPETTVAPALPPVAPNAAAAPKATASPKATTSNPASCGTGEEALAFKLLNAFRAGAGLTPVSCDPVALEAARAHSRDMCQRGYFSHQSPEGTQPWDRLRSAGARFSAAGENIAEGYSSGVDVHAGWLASSGHRQNMENPGWRRAAVGLAVCDGKLYWTELFLA